ncbi:ferredoxin [Streptomyces sp. STR69]|uniref:ferredoxin n=1 Tax=Streptomyces sp. STR69 TaxID=1796942 RepID=UPI0021C88771|nr:ferredoxin [Streptomyces sp. STR69]
MKAVVDTDRCRGHGICWSICPEVFDLTDDGYAEVLTPEVPTEYEAQVREAISSCPERAITVT